LCLNASKAFEKQAFIFIALVEALVHYGYVVMLETKAQDVDIVSSIFLFSLPPTKNPIKI
jgi:hypothetical protein